MKTLTKFFQTNPSYFKCGTATISSRVNLAQSTVLRFKRTAQYKDMKKLYISSL